MGNWRTGKEKQRYQLKPKVSVQRYPSYREDKARRKFSKETQQKRRTLQNEMLFGNLVSRLKALNPNIGEEIIDRIDRNLEYDEALGDLKKKLVNLITSKADVDKMNMKQYRDWLDEQGITNNRLQNLIMRDDKPPTEEEIAELSYLISERPLHNKKTDNALKAPEAKSFRQWMKAPNRTDIRTLDSVGTKIDDQ